MSSPEVKHAAFNLTASGDLVAAVTGRRIVLYGITLISSAAFTMTIKNGSGGSALFGPVDVPAGGGWNKDETGFPYLEGTTKGTALYLTLTGTGNVGGVVAYKED